MTLVWSGGIGLGCRERVRPRRGPTRRARRRPRRRPRPSLWVPGRGGAGRGRSDGPGRRRRPQGAAFLAFAAFAAFANRWGGLACDLVRATLRPPFDCYRLAAARFALGCWRLLAGWGRSARRESLHSAEISSPRPGCAAASAGLLAAPRLPIPYWSSPFPLRAAWTEGRATPLHAAQPNVRDICVYLLMLTTFPAPPRSDLPRSPCDWRISRRGAQGGRRHRDRTLLVHDALHSPPGRVTAWQR